MQASPFEADHHIHILIMQHAGQRKMSLSKSDILRFEHCVDSSSIQHLQWNEHIRTLFVTFGRSPVSSDFRIRLGVCLPQGNAAPALLFVDECPLCTDEKSLAKAILDCQSEFHSRRPPVAVIMKRLEGVVAPFLFAAPEASLRHELSELFVKAPLTSVFMLSAIYSAATSSRRAFLCRPFPAMFSSNQQCNYDDLTSALHAAGQVLRMSAFPTLEDATMSFEQAAVSLWSIDIPCAAAAINTSRVLDGLAIGPDAIPPICIELGRHLPPSFQISGATYRGYHGTSFENVYSILLNGLQNYSGTERMGTGDNFGNGIYLSGDPGVARSFSKPGKLIDGGGSVSVMFECLILKDPSVICSATAGSTPSSYFIVPREDLVVVTHIWFWRSHPPRYDAQAQRMEQAQDLSMFTNLFFLFMLIILCWVIETFLRIYLSNLV
jgi:hypothetical protein